jgi:hypothetical protein
VLVREDACRQGGAASGLRRQHDCQQGGATPGYGTHGRRRQGGAAVNAHVPIPRKAPQWAMEGGPRCHCSCSLLVAVPTGGRFVDEAPWTPSNAIKHKEKVSNPLVPFLVFHSNLSCKSYLFALLAHAPSPHHIVQRVLSIGLLQGLQRHLRNAREAPPARHRCQSPVCRPGPPTLRPRYQAPPQSAILWKCFGSSLLPG